MDDNSKEPRRVPKGLIVLLTITAALLVYACVESYQQTQHRREVENRYQELLEAIRDDDYARANELAGDRELSDYKDVTYLRVYINLARKMQDSKEGRNTMSYFELLTALDPTSGILDPGIKERSVALSATIEEELEKERARIEEIQRQKEERWAAERAERESARQKAASTSKSHPSKSGHSSVYQHDRYDVYNYDDVEDFYEDNYDDFDDIDDAASYYEDAWDDHD